MDKKQLAKLSVKCLVLKHTQQSREYIKNKSYQEEVDYLVRNETRNNFVKNLCLDLQGNTLCLFQFVEKHGEVLYNLLKDSPNKKVFFIHGGVETDERERVRGIVEKSDNAIIIASYGTFSTGVNIRNLHNLVFAFSGKSRIRHLQSIGRSLRLGDNKTDATMYDITDDLSIEENKNYTLQHFLERINIYNEEQFDYEIHNVELKK
jgi:superfamily II DNA or RNA helicase